MATTVTRSVTAKALAGPKTLHPVALRKLGVKVPEVPELAESPAVVPKETAFSPPVWGLPSASVYEAIGEAEAEWDDYSPTTPPRCPLNCSYGSREHVQWIIDTTK